MTKVFVEQPGYTGSVINWKGATSIFDCLYHHTILKQSGMEKISSGGVVFFQFYFIFFFSLENLDTVGNFEIV